MFWLRVSTAITELVAVKPEPANKNAKLAKDVFCSVDPSESNVAKKSPLVGVTVENSEKSTVKTGTGPVKLEPLKPTPAVIPVRSPEAEPVPIVCQLPL